MIPDLLNYLTSPAIAVVASLVFYWLVHRETRKTAALVAQLKEEFRHKLEKQARCIHELSAEVSSVPLSEDVKEWADELRASAAS
jgi:hypothetical protein